MKPPATPTFNVIFVEHTVRLQQLGVLSLLDRTPWNYRLVANGTGPSETEQLMALASSTDRLDVVVLPTDRMLPHGTALNWLWDYDQHPDWFCFCDSDVFAIGELTQIGAPMDESLDVFSSCSRIENDPNATYAGFKGGATTRTPQGFPLAAAFFCCYRRTQTQQAIDRYALGFEQYARLTQVPSQAQTMLEELGIDFEFMDTAKLLSLAIHDCNGRLVHRDDDNLVHIGGLSGRSGEGQRDQMPFVLDDTALGSDDPSPMTSDGRRLRSDQEKRRKKLLGRYFYHWLSWLAGDGPKPQLTTVDAKLAARLTHLAQGLQDIYENHQEIFNASS